jgi:hypothetical protein
MMMAHPEKAKTCSCFLQQFENTGVLRRTFIHLISTSIESHNRDDATKEDLPHLHGTSDNTERYI